MKITLKAVGIASLFALGGCVAATPEGQTIGLTEEVLALVAPGQDTTNVRIERDGCYWYLHSGPVEDTFIPLLTRDGRMICTRGQGIPISEAGV